MLPELDSDIPVYVIALVALFNEQDELLLIKRPGNAHCGGLWSLPGGKVEDRETPLEAAVRELKEETGITGRMWRHLAKSSHRYPDRQLYFLLFCCRAKEISALAVKEEYAWVPLDKLDDYPMPEANTALTPKIQPPA